MFRRIEQILAVSCIAMGLLLAAGCATAPDEWRTNADRVSRTACGAYAEVETEGDETIEGELLAVASSVVYVLDGDELYSVARGRIRQTVTMYSRNWAAATGIWGALGAVSTLSHGFILLLSAPIWLATTGISTAIEVGVNRRKKVVPEPMRARFPQGLPGSIQSELKPLDPSRVDKMKMPDLAGGCPPDDESSNEESSD